MCDDKIFCYFLGPVWSGKDSTDQVTIGGEFNFYNFCT